MNASSTVTKYFHWRLLKQGRKAPANGRNAAERHTIALGMVRLQGLGFGKPIILEVNHARTIQFEKCKDSDQGKMYEMMHNSG